MSAAATPFRLEEFLAGKTAAENKHLFEEAEEAPATPIRVTIQDDGGPLSDDERLLLRRLVGEPGWAVFLKVSQRIVRRHVARATVVAENDPLNNQTAVTNAWAYAGIAKAIMREMLEMTDAVLREERR